MSRVNLSITYSIFLLIEDLDLGLNSLCTGNKSVSVCIFYGTYFHMNAAQCSCVGAGDQGNLLLIC